MSKTTILKSEHFLCIANQVGNEIIPRNASVDLDADLSNDKVEQILIEFVNETEIDHKDFIIITSEFLKNFDLFEEEYLSEILRVRCLLIT
jgi:hypothetical protein